MMLYDIHSFDENITGINVYYKDTKVLYIIDTCNVHLFESLQYDWKHKTSGDNTEPILYYPLKVDKKVKHIQYKRFITQASEKEWVSTINNNHCDLRINNLIKHPMGRKFIKEKLVKDNKHLLNPYELDFDLLKSKIEETNSLNKIPLNGDYRISFGYYDNFAVITDICTKKSIIVDGDISKETKEDLAAIFNPNRFINKREINLK